MNTIVSTKSLAFSSSKHKKKKRQQLLGDRARLQCDMASQASSVSPTTSLRISQVNSLSDEDFITTFGNVIEHCSLVAAAVVKSRPFHSLEHLHAEICSFIDELPVKGEEKELQCSFLFNEDQLGSFIIFSVLVRE